MFIVFPSELPNRILYWLLLCKFYAENMTLYLAQKIQITEYSSMWNRQIKEK